MNGQVPQVTGEVPAAQRVPHQPTVVNLPSIERLTGRDNWSTWKFAMETYLELEDFWDVVKPAVNADGTLPQIDARKCRKARGKIILLLDPSNYVHVKGATTAREVWTKLEAAFEDTGLTRHVGLLRKLITTTLTACGSMEIFVNEIVSTTHQLRGVGFEISEEWIGTLLLAGLPEEYKPMLMALENSGLAITGDSIKTKLLQEVHLVPEKTAFVGRKPYPPKQKPSVAQGWSAEQPKGPKCKRCHRYGHVARDCQTTSGTAFATVLATNGGVEDDSWIFDSGASEHFTKNRGLLTGERAASGVVMAADKQPMDIVATGTVMLEAKCNPQSLPIEVQDVKFIPSMSNNLLSVSQIVRRGLQVRFSNRGVRIEDADGDLIATGRHDVKNGLFRFDEKQRDIALTLASPPADMDVWHRRMGHLGNASLKMLRNGLVTGVQFKDTETDNCVVCAKGKQTRLPFPKKGHRANDILELVHTDVCGPMEETSVGGSRYYVSFVDDKTRRISVFFLESKSESEVLRAFDDFRSLAERQTGKKLKTLRSDNGKEYVNRSFQKRLRELGIKHETTTEYTPEQNGLAERVNRTSVERARCMLFEAKLPKSFWAEAVAAAVYLINRSPTKGHNLTPEEAWSGRKPDLSHVRVFGTKAMAHIPKQKRKKWDEKSKETILVGFDELTKAYRLYDPAKKTIIKSRDVIFIGEAGQPETTTPAGNSSPQRVRTFVSLEFEDVSEPVAEAAVHEIPLVVDPDVPDVEGGEAPEVPPALPIDAAELELSDDESESEAEFFSQVESSVGESSDDSTSSRDVTILALPPRKTLNPPESQVLRRSGRERAIPGKYKNFVIPNKGLPFRHPADNPPSDAPSEEAGPSGVQHGLKASRGSSRKSADPRTLTEALRSDDADLWRAAMDEEHRALMDNNTWELVQLPADKKAIGCKWLFKTKHDEHGRVVRHKARIVAQGFTQKFGTDYDEVFAPVAKQVTFRVLLTIAGQRNSVVKHVDVKTAYLNGELEETIYMRQPEGYSTGDERTVCRLRRSLYGLKQSARVWNRKVDSTFKSFGFQQSKSDPCLYMRRQNGTFAYILIYVDDMVIVTQTEEEFNAIFGNLQRNFTVTNLGDIRHFLGMEVERSDSGYKLNQATYIRKLVQRFNLEQAKPSKVPLDPGYLQQKEEECKPLSNNQDYLSLIGGLLYVAVHTRPDIAVSTSILAQKSSKPNQQDWNEAKRVLRYLDTTINHKLHLGAKNEELRLFVDADWAGNSRDRKSNSGFLMMFGGGLVAWGTRKQTCVALSSTEAEFVALAEGCQELIWTRRLLEEIGEAALGPTTVLEDNQSCMKLVDSDKIERRSKHIETRYFFVRDLQEKETIRLQYCPTEDMLADLMTKPLAKIKLEKMRSEIGIRSDQIEEEC